MIHSNHRLSADSSPGEVTIESHYCGEEPDECRDFSVSYKASEIESVFYSVTTIMPVTQPEGSDLGSFFNAAIILIAPGSDPNSADPQRSFSFGDKLLDAQICHQNILSHLGLKL